MVTQKERIMESVTTRVLVFFNKNKIDSGMNKNNGTLSAEDFITDLFNLLYEAEDPKYFNTKKLGKNYPGIDILSAGKKQGVQVTVRTDTQKVKNTFAVIPTCKENPDYSELLFVVQTGTLPPNLLKIKTPYEGYSLKFSSATEILREIEAVEVEHLERICAYVEKTIVPPDAVFEEKSVDADVFNILFTSLRNNLSKKEVMETDDSEEVVYKTSPTKKREKFSAEWPMLEQLYKDSLGLKVDGSESGKLIAYHKYVEEAFSQDLSEDDKDLVQRYLKTKSALILHENNGDPIKALNQMVSIMKEELDLGFVSSSHVLSFVLNMFFKCDVFPLLSEKI